MRGICVEAPFEGTFRIALVGCSRCGSLLVGKPRHHVKMETHCRGRTQRYWFLNHGLGRRERVIWEEKLLVKYPECLGEWGKNSNFTASYTQPLKLARA